MAVEKEWFTVSEFVAREGLHLNARELMQLGQRASAHSSAMGQAPRQRRSAYGKLVNAYSLEVLRKAYGGE